MIKNLIYAALVALVFFTGCSNVANVEKTTITKVKQTMNMNENDQNLDEFDDEFDDEEESDPLKGYNVFMTDFNDGFYIHIFDPVARGYDCVMPESGQESIGNFFHNIMYPIRLINNIFQGKFANASEETGRFLINSTFGILGLFDPAKDYFDLEPHNEDFGQTLGHYGVGSGYHIVLPFFGPSNMRDMFSMIPDSYANPVDYHSHRGYNFAENSDQSFAIKAYEKLNNESLHIGEYENIKKDAVDLYPFLKDIYEQHRKKLIKE